MIASARTLVVSLILVVASALSSLIVYAGLQYGDTRWVTIVSTERALLREYKLKALDLEYLEKKGQITERKQLQLDQLRIDIEELEQEFK